MSLSVVASFFVTLPPVCYQFGSGGGGAAAAAWLPATAGWLHRDEYGTFWCVCVW